MQDESMQEKDIPSEEPMAYKTEPKKRMFAGWWSDLKFWEKAVSIVCAVLVLFLFYVSLDANKYQAVVRVVEGEGRVGVNPTTERLDFGDLSRGTSAVRTVTIKNGTIMPMYVMMVKTGSIADLVDIDTNYLKVPRGAEQKIEFQTYIPASAAIDATYKGRVYVFKIPTFWL
ncbi:MAG: hypothetical protein AAB630_00605 [Patescibacteria group bacterium]